MTDLFASMEESTAEREAIKAADGIEFDEDERHRCEVSWVMRAFYPDGKRAAEYFDLVEKKRGKESADKLRQDCRAEWKQWKIADSIVGQA
ncbi:MAG: hypothetical protein IPI16_17555 [Comamonadaceae bacterium]|nr:hypothetical protein [Comamonadaceae bacterium]